ncbi:CvfB family protein [Savagea faecisuis]|uniref:S1 RNA-binding domain-containing protein n=1 Tax=Savagea faecisuis TaxID=1274803 RepID=A0ABW3GXU9_9BACL
MTTIQAGTIVTGTVSAQEGSRWVIEVNNEEILMNESDALEPVEVGQEVDVFVYLNRREQLIATTILPNMSIGTYGYATVLRSERSEGVFVDIGSTIEVLVDRTDLPKFEALWPKKGDQLYMTLRTDKGGTIYGRLATEDRVQEQIELAPEELFNADLKARPYRLLPVGTFLLTEDPMYRIFVHETEREKEPRLGELVDVRIIKVKEDGTMNGSLLPRKEERLDDDADQIYMYLTSVGGEMPFTDRSAPEEIQDRFDMSKGAFKRALGRLMKKGLIEQSDGWTKKK